MLQNPAMMKPTIYQFGVDDSENLGRGSGGCSIPCTPS
jgi:hypothetical protein